MCVYAFDGHRDSGKFPIEIERAGDPVRSLVFACVRGSYLLCSPPNACARLFLVVLLCYSANPLVTRRLGRSGTQATQADPQATGSTTPEAPLRYMASSVCTVFNPTSESVPT